MKLTKEQIREVLQNKLNVMVEKLCRDVSSIFKVEKLKTV